MNARIAIFAAVASVGAALVWWSTRQSSAPAATWRVGRGTSIEQASNYAELPAESPFRLSVHTGEPLHTYVFSHSVEDGTVLLWPAADLRSDLPQPLPPGQSVLPGARNGQDLLWTTRSQIKALTTYVVVMSRRPVAELDTLLPRLRRWTTSVLTDGSMLVTNPVEKPVSGLTGLPKEGWPAPLLQLAADRYASEVLVNGPLQPAPGLDGVWFAAWRVKEQAGTAKVGDGSSVVLPDALKALQAPTPPAAPDKR